MVSSGKALVGEKIECAEQDKTLQVNNSFKQESVLFFPNSFSPFLAVQWYPLLPLRCTDCLSSVTPEVNGCHPGLTTAKHCLTAGDLGHHSRPLWTYAVRCQVPGG